MMSILKAIGTLSDTSKIVALLQTYLSEQSLDSLQTFCAHQSLSSEQFQRLEKELDAIFRSEQKVQYFLNHEKEGEQTIGQLIVGNQLNIATDYGIVIAGLVMGDVNIDQVKPVGRLLTSLPQIDQTQVIGRDNDVAKIRDLFKASDKVLLVNGLGGIGKTTVAKVFLKEHDAAFQHLAWVNVTGGNVKEAFATNKQLLDSLHLAKTIAGLERNQDFLNTAFDLIINRMRHLKPKDNMPNLLIIDNAQEDIEHSQTLDYIALKPHWKVLVTSREDLLGFEKYTLGLLAPEDAKALFYLHYKYKLHQQANAEALIEEILELIDYHTLSIELIAKTAEAKRFTLAEVLDTVKKKGLTILESTEDDSYIQFLRNFNQRERKVYAFLLSIFELAGLTDMEQWTAKQFAVMPSIPIQLEQNDKKNEQNLTHLLQIKKGKPRSEFIDALNSLQKSGWLTHSPEEDAFKMHNLIQDIMRAQLKPGFGDCEQLFRHTLTSLSIDEHKDNPLDKFIWVNFGQYLLKYLSNIPLLKQSHLQNNVALVHQDMGNFPEAQQLLEAALKGDIQALGKQNPTIAARKSNLALVYQDLGNFHQAVDLLAEALEINIECFGEKDATVAVRRSNLGLVYLDLGKFEEARQQLEKALASDTNRFGEKHPMVAARQTNLANIYRELDKYQEAEALFKKAHETYTAFFDKDHPNVVTTLSNLGVLYQAMGKYQEAKSVFERTLQSAKVHLGENHPVTTMRQANLAMVFLDLGEYPKAKQLLEEALAIDANQFGTKHPRIYTNKANLAQVLGYMGEYDMAIELLEFCLKAEINLFGQDHPNVAITESKLASMYEQQGNYQLAESLYKKALKTNLKHFGKDHTTTATSQANLGSVYFSMKAYPKAENALGKALKCMIPKLGVDHPEVAILYENFGLACLYTGKFERGLKFLNLAYRVYSNTLPKNHPSIQRLEKVLPQFQN